MGLVEVTPDLLVLVPLILLLFADFGLKSTFRVARSLIVALNAVLD